MTSYWETHRDYSQRAIGNYQGAHGYAEVVQSGNGEGHGRNDNSVPCLHRRWKREKEFSFRMVMVYWNMLYIQLANRNIVDISPNCRLGVYP